ncbi:hypothetical protein Vadar_026471 [Vaccinium darrowii]|uniref:Uncharacterized protein n=1 Tax=Vaccinium darrowii TaxID=229202 RepID=A0ACB7Y8W7_9ERIC|nr:hypothetical protein Vadar_026471 [Vaccinium darrowii]
MEEETGKGKERDEESPNKNNSNQIHNENPAKKAKSCKGCVYYSSTLKSNSRNPLCVGITRSLPQVPHYIVGESEIEASREGRSLADFKYACVGYSVYSDRKGISVDAQEMQAELPICVGLEVLVDKKVNTVVDPVPAGVQNKEDAHEGPPPRMHKPAHSAGDEFLNRFSRNASVVAMGVAKNLRRVGNQIKDRLDDILYPYRRRPK